MMKTGSCTLTQKVDMMTARQWLWKWPIAIFSTVWTGGLQSCLKPEKDLLGWHLEIALFSS
jgi:hypothetical protein